MSAVCVYVVVYRALPLPPPPTAPAHWLLATDWDAREPGLGWAARAWVRIPRAPEPGRCCCCVFFTSTGNELVGDAMWRTHGGDKEPCCIEIERKHGDLWVFDDAINGRQKIWVGGELVALFHKPQAVSGRWGFVYIHDLHRPPGHRPR
jgi:hypothetical protein